eukprot:scaffold183929_cov30-Tisochrysis_lutea.AAC.2
MSSCDVAEQHASSVPPSIMKRLVTCMLPIPRQRMVSSLVPSAAWLPLMPRTTDATPGNRAVSRSALAIASELWPTKLAL